MLNRIYADNYRTFVNFELRPGRVALLLGENGTGKSNLTGLVADLRALIAGDLTLRKAFPRSSLTRWDTRFEQSFEADVTVDGRAFAYRLVVRHDADRVAPPTLVEEMLTCDGRRLFSFSGGEIRLFWDDGAAGPVIPTNPDRSALSSVTGGEHTKLLGTFKAWWDACVWLLHPMPVLMSERTDEDGDFLLDTMDNLASWYPGWLQTNLGAALQLQQSLRESIPGLSALQVASGRPVLQVEFEATAGVPKHTVSFTELSEGQKQLVALWLIRHALLCPGHLVMIDEPDNFVALAEIQPWLAEVIEATESTDVQLWLISHHPEVINMLAPDAGVVFSRERGPTRVGPLEGVDGLSAAEVVARRWQG